jgi:uncharacterized protein (TIGR02268 family)
MRFSSLAQPSLLPCLVLPLLLTGVASAQSPAPAREREERRLVLPSGPEAPVPEVRIASGVSTWLRFDSPIEKASVELDGRATRFREVDVGERTLLLVPSVEPGPGERLGLRVRFRDGASPRHASFALVSHPSRVDKELEVVRHARHLEVLEAELAQSQARCETGDPAGFVLSGLLVREGVQVSAFTGQVGPGNTSGLKFLGGEVYRTTHWVVVTLRLRNLGQQSWALGEARLTDSAGNPVKVRALRMDRAELAPGERGSLALELEPSALDGAPFRLELVDKGGHLLLPLMGVSI